MIKTQEATSVYTTALNGARKKTLDMYKWCLQKRHSDDLMESYWAGAAQIYKMVLADLRDLRKSFEFLDSNAQEEE